MYELRQLTDKTYYIESGAKIGLHRVGEDEVILIDAGNDEQAGRKIRQILQKNNWKLKAIYNTHSNADHIGGNAYLQKFYGCPIYSSGIEAAFTNYPVLEPSFLYGGYPYRELRSKFLMAKPSVTTPFDPEKMEGLELIDLDGHFFEMKGFRTDDGVIFLADCLISQKTLEKHPISFIYDIQAYLDTLDKVEKLEAEYFVAAHAEVSRDIKETVRANREKILEIERDILEFLKEPATFEQLLKYLFDRYEIGMDHAQYVLSGSTIRSYLSWLKDQKKADAFFKDNQMYWKSLNYE